MCLRTRRRFSKHRESHQKHEGKLEEHALALRRLGVKAEAVMEEVASLTPEYVRSQPGRLGLPRSWAPRCTARRERATLSPGAASTPAAALKGTLQLVVRGTSNFSGQLFKGPGGLFTLGALGLAFDFGAIKNPLGS
jgi:hypothetical protein